MGQGVAGKRYASGRRMPLAAAVCVAGIGALAPPAGATDVLNDTVASSTSKQRTCHERVLRSGGGYDQRRVVIPGNGQVRARLAGGRGDWDLGIFEADSGRPVAGAAGFGADEVASGFVAEGQELVIQACHYAGGAGGARLDVDAFPLPPPSGEKVKLLHVTTRGPGEKRRLQGLGLDLTEHGRDGFLDVVTYGPDEEAKLRNAGFAYQVEDGDLAASDRARARADRRYSARAEVAQAGRKMPSGRTQYRTLADYEADMKALVKDHPNLVQPIELPFKTVEGRTVSGIEITDDVGERDGKPVFMQLGTHHAREWPSSEHAMEWAFELVKNYGKDDRTTSLVKRARTIVVPVVNPDGFNFSRGTSAVPAPDTTGPDPNTSRPDLTDPTPSYKRKNCNTLGSGQASCAPRQSGVDPNRNYGAFWGGDGAGTDPADETYRGSGPFSEAETLNIRDLMSKRQVNTMITNHTFSDLVLRPPGLAVQGEPPDEPIYKALGDLMAQQNGYVSQRGYELYDTSGTTEDWSYNATGGLGFTFEIGNQFFHPPFEQAVVNEYFGTKKHPFGVPDNPEVDFSGKGNREAYFKAMESSVNDDRHSLIEGKSSPNAILRLRKTFQTPTSQTGTGGTIVTFEDKLDSTTRVPASGNFRWHVNPSTRPLLEPKPGYGPNGSDPPSPEQTFQGDITQPTTPCANFDTTDPDCYQEREITIPGLPADNGSATFRIEWTSLASDYDMKIFRKNPDGTRVKVGQSGQGNTDYEQSTVIGPQPGTYVVRVIYWGAVGQLDPWTGKVTFGPSQAPEAGKGKEMYDLTCESGTGRVLEATQVQVDRGQAKDLGSFCAGRDLRGSPVTSLKGTRASYREGRYKVSLRGLLKRNGVPGLNAFEKKRRCKGPALLRVKTRRTIVTKRVKVSSKCTFSKILAFGRDRLRPSERGGVLRRLRVSARFEGSRFLRPARTRVTKPKVRR